MTWALRVSDVIGLAGLKQQFEILKLPLVMRRKILRKVSGTVIKQSRARVRTQTDLQGRPFRERWKKRSDRRKMLSKLAKLAKVLRNDGKQAELGFPGVAGRIAAAQQFGQTQTVTAAALKRGPAAQSARNDPATKRQAVELKKLGYRAGKKNRKPTMQWIMNNLTIGQAGSIIRSMREKQGIHAKTTWRTVLPARAFFGATAQDVAQYIQDIFTHITQELARGTR